MGRFRLQVDELHEKIEPFERDAHLSREKREQDISEICSITKFSEYLLKTFLTSVFLALLLPSSIMALLILTAIGTVTSHRIVPRRSS